MFTTQTQNVTITELEVLKREIDLSHVKFTWLFKLKFRTKMQTRYQKVHEDIEVKIRRVIEAPSSKGHGG